MPKQRLLFLPGSLVIGAPRGVEERAAAVGGREVLLWGYSGCPEYCNYPPVVPIITPFFVGRVPLLK